MTIFEGANHCEPYFYSIRKKEFKNFLCTVNLDVTIITHDDCINTVCGILVTQFEVVSTNPGDDVKEAKKASSLRSIHVCLSWLDRKRKI
jgi:hypothetical protein